MGRAKPYKAMLTFAKCMVIKRSQGDSPPEGHIRDMKKKSEFTLNHEDGVTALQREADV